MICHTFISTGGALLMFPAPHQVLDCRYRTIYGVDVEHFSLAHGLRTPRGWIYRPEYCHDGEDPNNTKMIYLHDDYSDRVLRRGPVCDVYCTVLARPPNVYMYVPVHTGSSSRSPQHGLVQSMSSVHVSPVCRVEPSA